jgi:hypothetical protein
MYNIHAMFMSRQQKDELTRHMKAVQPSMCVVMDDIGFAVELKKAVPGMEVVHRDFRYDLDHAHRQMSPATWIGAHQPAAEAGLTLYADNETAWDAASIAWFSEVARLCVARKWKVVLGNFSVGTPGENSWSIGKDLLTYIGQNRQYLRLGLHEYMAALWTYEFGRETDRAKWGAVNVPTDAKPYICGRYRWLLDYCRDNNIPAPLIAITEWGMDTIHAVIEWQRTLPGFHARMGVLRCETVYRQWGGDPWRYAYESLKYLWEKVYKPDSANILGVALFCYGGAGDWGAHFDFSKTSVPSLIEQEGGFKKGSTPVAIIQGSTVEQKIISNIPTLNRRAQPSTSAAIKGTLKSGDLINLVIDSDADANGYEWRRIVVAGVSEWIAIKGPDIDAQFTSPPAPEPPLSDADRAAIRAFLNETIEECNRLLALL